jgi:hypothetical protein
MKMRYKNLLFAASGAVMCLFLALPASAQHNGGGSRTPSGSSGTSSSPSPSVSAPRSSGGGGGGVSSARPSGGAGIARPSGGGIARPSQGGGVQRGVAPQRSTGYVNRQGVAVRGNYGYAPRQGAGVTARGNLRGNYGYPQRTGIAPRSNGYGVTSGYRTAPKIGYGHGGYWGTHGYNYHNHGYYRSGYYPRIGFTCSFLPFGYYPFFWGDYQYFYSDGFFYQYDNTEYTVVEPPIGAEIAALPDKAQSIVINGQQYYELNGVYYQQVTKDDGSVVYMVVGKDGELNTGSNVQDDQPRGPQMGDIVAQLPQDCRKIKVNGQKLWVSPDGVYYQEQVDAQGVKTYKIVGLPADDSDQN